jgi:hypothetical protein
LIVQLKMEIKAYESNHDESSPGTSGGSGNSTIIESNKDRHAGPKVESKRPDPKVVGVYGFGSDFNGIKDAKYPSTLILQLEAACRNARTHVTDYVFVLANAIPLNYQNWLNDQVWKFNTPSECKDWEIIKLKKAFIAKYTEPSEFFYRQMDFNNMQVGVSKHGNRIYTGNVNPIH